MMEGIEILVEMDYGNQLYGIVTILSVTGC